MGERRREGPRKDNDEKTGMKLTQAQTEKVETYGAKEKFYTENQRRKKRRKEKNWSFSVHHVSLSLPADPQSAHMSALSAHMFLLLHDRLCRDYRKPVSVLGGGGGGGIWTKSSTFIQSMWSLPVPGPTSSLSLSPPSNVLSPNNDNITRPRQTHEQHLLFPISCLPPE